MRNKWFLLIGVAVVVAMCVPAGAGVTVVLVADDSGPNVYGSPDYPAWWEAAKADVVAGTFTNMRNGTYPGTSMFDPYDAIVYSTDDLGKRLHWIYWLPDETVAGLAGRFQVRTVYDVDGVPRTYDWGTGKTVVATPDNGWSQPGSWINYTSSGKSGVIGTFGNAWWAGDDDALPYSTDTDPYNETNQADIDVLRAWVFEHQTFWTGEVRYRDAVDGEWQVESMQLTVAPVPEPLTMASAFFAIGGLGAYIRRRKQAVRR